MSKTPGEIKLHKTTKYLRKRTRAIALWRKYDGHKTNICRDVNIARSTLDKWLTEPKFKMAIINHEYELKEDMEKLLREMARKKNLGALIFWLKNNTDKYAEKKIGNIQGNVDVKVINYNVQR